MAQASNPDIPTPSAVSVDVETGEVLDSRPEEVQPGWSVVPSAEQNGADRDRLLGQIETDSKYLGLTVTAKARNWKDYVGPGVLAEDADIAKIMALADYLAGEVRKAQRVTG
jgi:hypothetical protein